MRRFLSHRLPRDFRSANTPLVNLPRRHPSGQSLRFKVALTDTRLRTSIQAPGPRAWNFDSDYANPATHPAVHIPQRPASTTWLGVAFLAKADTSRVEVRKLNS